MPKQYDPELLAMARITRILKTLSQPAQVRVLGYHLARAQCWPGQGNTGFPQEILPFDNRLPDPGDGTRENPPPYKAEPEAGSSMDQIDNLFRCHIPNQEQLDSYNAIYFNASLLATLIVNVCPAGPDRTAAIRKLRECVMTANAAIATGGGFFS